MRRSFCCILAIAVLSIAGIYALPAVSGDGRVVLTVVGDVKITNRGGRDNFTDKLITFQGSEFDRAMEFDDAALWALGTRKIKVSYPDWSEAHEFEGPLLNDVLAA